MEVCLHQHKERKYSNAPVVMTPIPSGLSCTGGRLRTGRKLLPWVWWLLQLALGSQKVRHLFGFIALGGP